MPEFILNLRVVVSLYNRMDVFPKVLESLLNQTLPSDRYAIFVVDDCSSDGAEAFLHSINEKFNNFEFIRNDTNKGLSTARNLGLMSCSEDIVLFLDADMVVEANFLECHLAVHESSMEKNIAAVSNIIYPEVFVGGSNFARFIQRRELGMRSWKDLKNIDLFDLEFNYFAGGATSVRSSVAKAIGGFDASFQGYGAEDEEFGFRLKKRGVQIRFIQSAIAMHNDIINFERYKLKLNETGNGNYRLLYNSDASYFDRTMIRYLLPIEFERDNLLLVGVKLLSKITFNKIFLRCAEYFVTNTDHIKSFYFPLIYRYITACWIYHSLRRGKSLVLQNKVW